MTFAEEFVEALEELEDIVPATFEWPISTANPPTSYPCFARGLSKGGNLEAFGQTIENDLTIIVRTDLFPAARPTDSQLVAFNGSRLRINSVMTAPGDIFLRLVCISASRGA